MKEEERVIPGDELEEQVPARPSRPSRSQIVVAAAFMLGALLVWNLRYAKSHKPYYQALDYLDKGQYEKAVEVLSGEIERDPDKVTAYYSRGKAYLEMGEYDSALKDCTKAIELDPQSAVPHVLRALARIAMGEYEVASRDIDKVIELEPSLLDATMPSGERLRDILEVIKRGGHHTENPVK